MPIGARPVLPYALNPTSRAGDNGAQFSVVVSNAFGAVTSTVATLTVNLQDWWNPQWRYRSTVEVNVGSFERVNKPVNAALNFTQLLAPLGGGTMNETSLRVIEVSAAGAIINPSVAFQFDRDPAYNAASNARGTLVFLLGGTTAANTTRYFDVYFDTAAGFSPATVPAQVTITDNIAHEGQSSFRIVTTSGTYYYHKQGGGFASFEDVNGNDWIGYGPTVGSGSAVEYRGIPNLGDVGHPGYLNSTSSIVSLGPLKATFQSQSTNGAWRYMWEVYPTYATLTLQQAGGSYWLLYEGTPGGTFAPATDTWTRSSGETLPCSQTFVGDIANPEWAYFRDGVVDRYLFLAHHEDDALEDQYYSLDGNMTVFGFGRQYSPFARLLTAVPAHLTIGLGDSSATAPLAINSAFRDLNVVTGAAELGQGTVTVDVVGNGSVNKNPNVANYVFGQVVELTAEPGVGTAFAGWSGAVSGTAQSNPIDGDRRSPSHRHVYQPCRAADQLPAARYDSVRTQCRELQCHRDGDGAVGVSMAAGWRADQRGDGQQLHVEPDGGGF